jgi:lipoprotein-releasing system permease protein
VAVIAFATACQLLVLTVFNGFEGLVKSLYSSFYTDVKVVPAKGKTFLLTDQQLQAIKQQPYIAKLSMIAEEKALLQNNAGETQTVIYLKGVDDAFEETAGVAANTYKGKFDLGTATQAGLIVGSGVQNKAGITVSEAIPSDSLTIILPRKNSDNNDPLQSLGEGNVKATGVFSIQQEFDDNYAITNLAFVKAQMGMAANEYSAVEIRLTEHSNIQEKSNAFTKYIGQSISCKNPLSTKHEPI